MNLLAPKTDRATVTPYTVAEDVRLRFPPRFIAAALTALLLLAVVFAVPPVPRQDSYLAGFIDKQRLLQSTCGEPRIIFVGGSNSAFGVDSRLIQERLHLKTINTGLHAAIGIRYMLNSVRPYLRRGDTVVVIPEYNTFFKLLDGSIELLQLIWIYPQGARYLSPEHAKTIALAVPNIMKRKWDVWSSHGVRPDAISPIYNRFAFDSFGDVVSHLDKPNERVSFNDHYNIGENPLDDRTTAVLDDFAIWCRDRGVNVLLSYPAIPMSLYKYNQNLPGSSGILLIENELKHKFRGTIIDAPLDNCFESNLFFNHVYHLNKEGRRLHTEALIERLRSILAAPGSSTFGTN